MDQLNAASRMLSVIDAFGHRHITFNEAMQVARLEAADYPDVRDMALDGIEGIQSWREFN